MHISTLRSPQLRIHHWVARTRDRTKPFVHREVALLFWNKLRKRFPTQVIAAALMDNHLHMIIASTRPHKIRWQLGVELRAFSRSYQRYQKPGSPSLRWEPIRNTLPIDDPKTLRRTLRYIHLNPCRAGMISNPWLWEFSTLRDWENATVLPWVSPAHLPELLGRSFHWYQSTLQSDAERMSDEVRSAEPPALIPLEKMSNAQIQDTLMQLLSTTPTSIHKKGITKDTFVQARLLRAIPFTDSIRRLQRETGIDRSRIRKWKKFPKHALKRALERISGCPLLHRMPRRGSVTFSTNTEIGHSQS